MSESGLPADGGAEAVAETAESGTTEATEAPQESSHQARINEQIEALTASNREWQEQQNERYEELLARLTPEEPEEDPYEGMEEDEAEMARAFVDNIRQEVRQELAPHLEEVAIKERQRDYDSFISQYTEMQDPEKAKPIIHAAQQFMEEIGRKDLINTPLFVRVIEREYKAAKADERAARETPARGEQTVLEQGGGAAPTQVEDDKDLVARIVNAGTPKNDLF